MKPLTPPMVNSRIKLAKNRNGTVNCGRPVQIVASQAKTPTADGSAMIRLAALKKASDTPGRPVANMWCTQTPKPSTMVATVASATAL